LLAVMRFAYADPPYLGCAALYKDSHSEAWHWDHVSVHEALIDRLCREYPDGWAMSCSSPSLRTLLGFCPDDVRVGAWVKPFAIFKPNVGTAYAWEPVIFRGGRRRSRDDATVRDWVSANITLKRGLTGAKPRDFCMWIIDLMNAQPGDQFDDLLPGTGAFGAAWAERCGAPTQEPLFTEMAP
jgi:hypothetical protein